MKPRVLIVDDDLDALEMMQDLFDSKGYKSMTAVNGIDAITKIKAQEPDIILSDIRMPEMDGIETIKQVRAYFKKETGIPPPEIIITGYADLDKYEEAKELQVTDYIYKPFDNEDFIKAIRKTIEKYKEASHYE